MALGKKVLRQFKKSFESDVTQQVTDSGEGSVTVPVSSIIAFADRVQKAYDENEDRLLTSHRNLVISSNELNERHAAIEGLNQSLKNILNCLGEGYLVIDSKGIVGNTFSTICVEIFGTNPAGRSVAELLGLEGEKLEEYKVWLDCAFTGRLDDDALNALGPDKFINHHNNHYRLSCRLLEGGGEVTGVTLIATNVTAEHREKLRTAEQTARVKIIDKIIKHRSDFNLFLNFTYEVLDEIESDITLEPEGVAKLKMDIHTIKGSASYFEMNQFIEVIHNCELKLPKVSEIKGDQGKEIYAAVLPVKEWIAKFQEDNKSLIGSKGEFEDYIQSSRQDLIDQISKNLQDNLSREDWILSIVGEPVEKILESYAGLAEKTAKQLDKPVNPMRIDAESIRIIPKYYNRLFRSFNHIVRNSIDHGIEEVSQRVSAGKEEAGNLSLSAKRVNRGHKRFIQFCFQDDGQGFDVASLRAKLKQQGVSEELSDDEVIQRAVRSELSSKAEKTNLSGLGVGMTAVYEETMRFSGKFEIDSQRGKGTKITVTVPEIVSMEAAQAVELAS